MIPARLAPIVIAAFISAGMSFLVSGLATYRALGLVEGFFATWMSSWGFAWLVAFPTLVALRPVVTKFVMSMVRQGS